jgi:sigma-B regulation protein RsbU (phosphoserine phosphatase)
VSDRPTLERRLIAALDRCEPQHVAAVARATIEEAEGVEDVRLWIADYGRIRLEDAVGTRPSKVIAGSIEGGCFSAVELVHHDGWTHLPIVRRGEALGVLSAVCRGDVVDDLAVCAIVVANAFDAGAGQSDEIRFRRGAAKLGLPATIQYSILPIPRHDGEWVQLGCAMEPAYDIAGDSYDYSVSDDGAHVGLFDAVGHGLRAALIASLVMGAYRRGRLFSRSVDKIAGSIHDVLAEELDDGEFVTGLVMWIDRRRGRLEILNAGHLPPLLVRGDTVTELRGSTNLPMGLGIGEHVTAAGLRPGDLIVAFTDGVVQARDVEDVMLGEKLVADRALLHRSEEPLRLCAELLEEVGAHVQRPLADDATLVIVRVGTLG